MVGGERRTEVNGRRVNESINVKQSTDVYNNYYILHVVILIPRHRFLDYYDPNDC